MLPGPLKRLYSSESFVKHISRKSLTLSRHMLKSVSLEPVPCGIGISARCLFKVSTISCNSICLSSRLVQRHAGDAPEVLVQGIDRAAMFQGQRRNKQVGQRDGA